MRGSRACDKAFALNSRLRANDGKTCFRLERSRTKARMRRFRGRLDSGGGTPILSNETHRREHGTERNAGGTAQIAGAGIAGAGGSDRELCPVHPVWADRRHFRPDPVRDGKMHYVGKLGGGMSIEEAQAAAKLCALNILAQLKAAAGGSRHREAVPPARRLRQLHTRFHPAAAGRQRRFGPDGRGLRGRRQARAHRGRRLALPGGVAVEVDAMFELG